MTDPTIRSNIKQGLKVKIEEKGNTGKLIEGNVKEILTHGEIHPHGIMVSLESGLIGRVKEILDSQKSTKSYETYNEIQSLDISLPKEEDLHNEFKSTFRFDLKRFEEGDGKKVADKDVEKEASITISGMANADGGKLFIGIRDNGQPIGLQNDIDLMSNSNFDKFRLKLLESIENYLKASAFLSSLRIIFPEVKNSRICVIEIPRANEPIFVHEGNSQEFYIRLHGKTKKIEPSEIVKYCATRFKK